MRNFGYVQHSETRLNTMSINCYVSAKVHRDNCYYYYSSQGAFSLESGLVLLEKYVTEYCRLPRKGIQSRTDIICAFRSFAYVEYYMRVAAGQTFLSTFRPIDVHCSAWVPHCVIRFCLVTILHFNSFFPRAKSRAYYSKDIIFREFCTCRVDTERSTFMKYNTWFQLERLS